MALRAKTRRRGERTSPWPTFEALEARLLLSAQIAGFEEADRSDFAPASFEESDWDELSPPTPSTAQAFPLIGLSAFRADPLFAGITGAGYSAVVIDTGVDLDHPFFGPDVNGNGIADRIVYQYDFADKDANASDASDHGSHVTSILASSDATYAGVAPGVNIIALKVYPDSGSGSWSYIEQALQWVVANAATYNVLSVNMSLGDHGNYSTTSSKYAIGNELAALANMNIIVSASAGNDFFTHNSVQGVAYPASDANVLAVGAVFDANFGSSSFEGGVATTTAADVIAPFSQRHATLSDIFAPGASIIAANRSGGTTAMHGTSMASPMVAGAAVLAQQLALQLLGRRLTLAEFTNLIKSTGVSIVDGDNENDNVTNTGLTFKRLDIHAMGLEIIDMAGGSPVSVSIGDAAVAEGATGTTTTAAFTVTLSAAPALPVTVRVDTIDATAIAADGDYVPRSNVILTFNPGGPLTQVVNVTVNGDGRVEPNQTFTVLLSNATGPLTIADGTGVGTIVNDDTLPTVTATTPSDGATTAARALAVDVVFSRPVVGVDAGDLLLSGAAAGGAVVGQPVQVASATWRFPVSGLMSGELELSIGGPASGIQDTFGNALNAYGWSVLVDLPPVVTRIALGGSDWSDGFGDVLATLGLGDGLGLTMSTGTPAQLAALPWVNVSRIAIRFNEDVDVAAGDLSMLDLTTGHAVALAAGGFTYAAGEHVATWLIAQPLNAVRLRLTLTDRLRDAAGNALDGEWTDEASTQSGDGAAGGALVMRMNVLPGDTDGSGMVDAADVAVVRAAMFQSAGAASYSPWLDLDCNGSVLANDAVLARNRQGSALPPAQQGAVEIVARVESDPTPPLPMQAERRAVGAASIRMALIASYERFRAMLETNRTKAEGGGAERSWSSAAVDVAPVVKKKRRGG